MRITHFAANLEGSYMRASFVLPGNRKESLQVQLAGMVVRDLLRGHCVGVWVEDIDAVQHRKLRPQGIAGIQPQRYI